MAIPTLEGCREKWARGTTLLNRVIELVGEYVGEEPPPHRTNGAFDAASGTYVITGEIVRPMPDPTMWAVLLGDAVHNLRSALDHLIWQLVLVNTGKDGSTDNQFPICDTGEGYWNPGKNGSPSQRTRRLKGVSREHMAIIDTFQAYRNYEARNQNRLDPLATLRDLSNHDKHRLLHVLIMAVDVQQGHKFRLVPKTRTPDNKESIRSWHHFRITALATS